MAGHTDSVTCMIVDEAMLFTGSDDGTIRQWNLGQFKPAGRIGDHEKQAIQSLVLIKESGLLLSCAQDKIVKVWYTVRNILLHTFPKTEEPLCLEYISEENQLLLGTESGNILTHDITPYIFFKADDCDDWPEF